MSDPFSPEHGRQLGDFRILRELGCGGMGTVYEALQVSLQRKVALKILSGGLGLSTNAVARFRREAEAAARLHHTNIVPVYSTGEDDGTHYYAMELVEGPSLKQVIEQFRRENRREPSPAAVAEGQVNSSDSELPAWVAETMTYEEGRVGRSSSGVSSGSSLESGPKYFETVARMMADVADALQHAHSRGVIHRDIKPSNLLLSRDGRLSVNDFGLARLLDQPGVTQSGEFVGSPLYMSPEQIAAGRVPVDHRTDIYSLGATLYELLTLQPPFSGHRREQVIAQILQKDARPPQRINGRVPIDLNTICLKALEKDPDARYQDGSTMAEDLRLFANGYSIKARRPHFGRRLVKFIRRNKSAVVASSSIVVLVVVSALGIWSALARQWKLDAERTAREQERVVREDLLPMVKRLIDSGRVVAAFAKATEARKVLPDDPVVNQFWSQVAVQASINAKPAGVRVLIRDPLNLGDTWSLERSSPFDRIWIPAGMLRWEFDKEGYARMETIGRASPGRTMEVLLNSEADLRRAGVDSTMVRVTPGRGRFGDEYLVEEFYIDMFEVSNKEYSRFIQCNGYHNAEYWADQVFEENGIKIPWQTAVSRFVDRTGRLGPSTWNDGTFPVAEADYPVRGVSWHEAVAYAKFVGKQLPTVYHWDRAADLDDAAWILPLSNFSQKGPAARDRYRGIGKFGVQDMAGNVKEWCWNEMEQGRRWLRGGAWDEPSYMFFQSDADSSLARPDNAGFRCVRYLANLPDSVSAPRKRVFRDYTLVVPVSADQVNAFKLLYFIDSKVPLEPITVSSKTTTTWKHETVSVNSAHRSGRLVLHLFLPRAVSGSCQCVMYAPHGVAFDTSKFGDGEGHGSIRRMVEKGRAVCMPIYMDMFERHDESRDLKINRFRERYLESARDTRRAVDYLQTRPDIDAKKLAFLGDSWGGVFAPVAVVVEPRFKACVMLCAGLGNNVVPPEVDPLNFAPQVNIPVLMLNGRYDCIFPVELSQEPLFRVLGSKDKQFIRYESGHPLPFEKAMADVNAWLDRQLGSAAQERE